MKKSLLVFTISVLCLVLITSLALAAQAPLSNNTVGQAATSTDSTIILSILLRFCPLESFNVGFVTDTAGINDQTINTSIWNGVLRARNDFNICSKYLESTDSNLYEPNLTSFASQDYDLVIASNFSLGGDLANVAALYPDINFTIVDYTYPDEFGVPDEGVIGHDECIPNVQGQIFKSDQAAFLAGYLAAGITETDKIGWFGGAKIPTVTIFGVGFQAGMEHYNQEHLTNIELLGWDSATGVGDFTNDWTDQDLGKAYTQDLFDKGADIFMPVGGMIGALGFDVARDRGGYGIWVDMDGYNILPGARDVMLTSVMKNIDNSVYDVIKGTMDGNFNGCGVYIGDMANAGVGIAPYHEFAPAVPSALKAEIEVLKTKIASGVISDTGCVSYPQHCPGGLY